MLTIDSLRAYGANVEEGLARCMNMEPFYLKVVGMVKDDVDGSFAKLKSAMAARDAQKTFEAAHALKGSTGNVALTPIFKPVCALSNMLKGELVTGGHILHKGHAQNGLARLERLQRHSDVVALGNLDKLVHGSLPP